jgi:hypothetical protein
VIRADMDFAGYGLHVRIQAGDNLIIYVVRRFGG